MFLQSDRQTTSQEKLSQQIKEEKAKLEDRSMAWTQEEIRDGNQHQ